MSLKVLYDEAQDILYLAREGQEAEAIEIAPGVTVELDAEGGPLGVEIFRASEVLRDVLKPLAAKAGRS